LADFVRSMHIKTNDQMLVVYLASLVRSVIALHNLIDNKIQNRDAEKNEGKDLKKDAAKKEEKGEGDAKKSEEKTKEADKKSAKKWWERSGNKGWMRAFVAFWASKFHLMKLCDPYASRCT